MTTVSIRADVARVYGGNTTVNVIYADLPTNLDVAPFSGDLSRLTNQNAVATSLRHIVLTIATERPYSQVGSTVNYRLFELSSLVQSTLLQQSILNAIKKFEPRVQNINVTVAANPNNNYIIITVQYTIININNQSFSTQVIIERNR